MEENEEALKSLKAEEEKAKKAVVKMEVDGDKIALDINTKLEAAEKAVVERGDSEITRVKASRLRSKVTNQQNSIDSLKTKGETLVGKLRTAKTSMATKLGKAKSAVESLEEREQAAKVVAEGLAKGGLQAGKNFGEQVGKVLQEFNQKVDSKRIELEVSPLISSCS